MKKRMYLFIALFMGASGLYAQDCATGYCPSTITVHHKAGDLSAVSGDITYNVVKLATTTPTCWITQNLGATGTPASMADATVSGWYYVPGRRQGWTGTVSNTTLVTCAVNDAWVATNDPCTLTLGSSWHIPTYGEWSQIVALTVTSWANTKINAAGALMYTYSNTSWTWLATTGANPFYQVQVYGNNTNIVQFANIQASLTMNQWTGSTPIALYIAPTRCIKTM